MCVQVNANAFASYNRKKKRARRGEEKYQLQARNVSHRTWSEQHKKTVIFHRPTSLIRVCVRVCAFNDIHHRVMQTSGPK